MSYLYFLLHFLPAFPACIPYCISYLHFCGISYLPFCCISYLHFWGISYLHFYCISTAVFPTCGGPWEMLEMFVWIHISLGRMAGSVNTLLLSALCLYVPIQNASKNKAERPAFCKCPCSRFCVCVFANTLPADFNTEVIEKQDGMPANFQIPRHPHVFP